MTPEQEHMLREEHQHCAPADCLTAALLAALDEARAVCAESNAVCLCGCPMDAHENYGEDGFGCGDDNHVCALASKAVKEEWDNFLDTHESEKNGLVMDVHRLEAERDSLLEQVVTLEATNRNNLGLLEVIEQIGVERDCLKTDLAARDARTVLLERFFATWQNAEATRGCYSCCEPHDCRCPYDRSGGKDNCKCHRAELDALERQLDPDDDANTKEGA